MATTATTKKSGTKFSTFKQQPSVACPFVQWSAATTCQVCFGARKSLRFEVLLICCWTLCGISFLACVIWQFSEHEASKFSWIKISVPSFCRPRSRLVIDIQCSQLRSELSCHPAKPCIILSKAVVLHIFFRMWMSVVFAQARLAKQSAKPIILIYILQKTFKVLTTILQRLLQHFCTRSSSKFLRNNGPARRKGF